MGGAAVALLLALAPCATASAASPTRVQRTAYRILINSYKAGLAITYREVKKGEAAAKRQLAPCVPALKGYSVPQGVVHTLETELELQYLAISLRPVVELEIAEDVRTEQLPIGSKLKGAIEMDAALDRALFKFNTCADVAAWQAAGFAASSEPSGTQFATALANTPTAHTSTVLYRMLSARQRRTIKPTRKKSDANAAYLYAAADFDLSDWLTSKGLPPPSL